MGNKNLSDVEKGIALAWRQEEVTFAEIARRLGQNISAIKKLCARARRMPTDHISQWIPQSRRPRKASQDADRLLRRVLVQNPSKTAGELKRTHPKVLKGVSERTIQHRLQKELNLPSHKACKKILLTKRMAKKLWPFARHARNLC